MKIFINIVLLILGLVFLVKGADFFVDGSSSIAKKLKVPTLIIGLTLVSIGTSLPEAAVSITASIKDTQDMGLGNIVGSSIFNTLVVVGLCSVFIPAIISKEITRYDLPIYLFIILLLLLFGFIITPNTLDRIESGILFAIFIIYMIFIVYRAKKSKEASEDMEQIKERKTSIAILLTLIGMAGVIGGGILTVNSAEYLAGVMGMSELLIGLTVVAVGTSLPELVTSLVAAKKGHNDIAVGNAIGSSILNIVFILGLSGVLKPINVSAEALLDIMVMLGGGLIIFISALLSKKVNKSTGLILTLIYVSYLILIILRELNIF